MSRAPYVTQNFHLKRQGPRSWNVKSKRGRKRNSPFLAGGVPNLSLDNLSIKIQTSSSKLDPNSGLRFEAEFIFGKAGKQIGLANARIADQDDLEEIVVVVFSSVGRHFSEPLSGAVPWSWTMRERERGGGFFFLRSRTFSLSLCHCKNLFFV